MSEPITNHDLDKRLDLLKSDVKHYNDDCRRDNELMRIKLQESEIALGKRIDAIGSDITDIKSSVKTILMACVMLFISAIGKWLLSGGLNV